MGSCDRGVDWRLVIRSVCNREVGESGDADGWRLCDRRYGNRIVLRGSDWFEWRGLKDLEFEVSARESERWDNGGCSGVFLAYASWL